MPLLLSQLNLNKTSYVRNLIKFFISFERMSAISISSPKHQFLSKYTEARCDAIVQDAINIAQRYYKDYHLVHTIIPFDVAEEAHNFRTDFDGATWGYYGPPVLQIMALHDPSRLFAIQDVIAAAASSVPLNMWEVVFYSGTKDVPKDKLENILDYLAFLLHKRRNFTATVYFTPLKAALGELSDDHAMGLLGIFNGNNLSLILFNSNAMRSMEIVLPVMLFAKIVKLVDISISNVFISFSEVHPQRYSGTCAWWSMFIQIWLNEIVRSKIPSYSFASSPNFYHPYIADDQFTQIFVNGIPRIGAPYDAELSLFIRNNLPDAGKNDFSMRMFVLDYFVQYLTQIHSLYGFRTPQLGLPSGTEAHRPPVAQPGVRINDLPYYRENMATDWLHLGMVILRFMSAYLPPRGPPERIDNPKLLLTTLKYIGAYIYQLPVLNTYLNDAKHVFTFWTALITHLAPYIRKCNAPDDLERYELYDPDFIRLKNAIGRTYVASIRNLPMFVSSAWDEASESLVGRTSLFDYYNNNPSEPHPVDLAKNGTLPPIFGLPVINNPPPPPPGPPPQTSGGYFPFLKRRFSETIPPTTKRKWQKLRLHKRR